MKSKNKSVLIVTPFFAPQSHAAVFRAYKLAKYLPQFGWKPYVLTVDTNYMYNEDQTLLSALPKDVEIHRTQYIEPTLRGLRMHFGGKDRTFKSVKHAMVTHKAEAVSVSWREKFYGYLRDHFLFTPDHYWTWYWSALKRASHLIRQNDISVIYTTCLPYTCLRIGLKLKDNFPDLKWLSDFRDPPTYSQTTCSKVDRVYQQQRDIERRAHARADAITGLAASYSLIFHDMYRAKSVKFIPTGVDEELLPKEMATSPFDHPYILFVGEFLKEYDETIFRLFAEALKNNDFAKENLKLIIAGNQNINRALTSGYIEKFKMNDHVKFLDHMPQQELYRYISAARAVTLIPGPHSFWWTNFAKLVDYMALEKPVLALVPNPSEARSTLSKAGLGIFLDGSFSDKLRVFSKFLTEGYLKVNPNPEECQKYLAKNMTKSFVEIFEKLTGF